MCPYCTEKCITVEMTPDEIVDKDNFFSEERRSCTFLSNIIITGKVGSSDLVVYSNWEAVVDCILADLEYWSMLEEKLGGFYVCYMVPEILSRKIFLEEYNCKS